MSNSRQLALRYDGLKSGDVEWARILRAMRDVVDFVGLKEVAFDLDMAPSGLAHALAERERYPRAEWLPYLIRKAPDFELARALVAPAGLDVLEPPPQTPEQELAALKSTLNELLGPEIRAAVYARAARKP